MTIVPVDPPSWLDVSRETANDLNMLCELVRKWNPKINLVSKTSLEQLWTRHILDSAQLFRLVSTNARLWCDLGSGGGFPGLVVAVLAKVARPEVSFVLVESDRRKATFLMQASRELDLNVAVRVARIEEVPPMNADIVSARALAPLADLCKFAHRHLAGDGFAIFPKGANAVIEIEAARRDWQFSLEQSPSLTDREASILLLKELRHV